MKGEVLGSHQKPHLRQIESLTFENLMNPMTRAFNQFLIKTFPCVIFVLY